MFVSILRSLAAVIAGLAVAFVMIVAVELMSSVLHPVPPGVDLHDIEACKAHVAKYPAWILALVVPIWGLTAFVGPWLATRLGTRRHPAHGIGVGLFLLVMVVFNMSMLPYPAWFWINAITFPICSWVGVKLGQGRQSEAR